MRVTVTYMAQVKRAAGTAAESVELAEGSTLEDLLAALAAGKGEAFAKLVFSEPGKLRDSLLLFVGEEPVRMEGGRTLREGDEVTFLSPLAGG